MKFPKLKIENFLAITSAELSLADRGLCLIQGVNHDDTSAESNGAGKSSIADALSWCLYGVTARGVTGDDVINDTAGKNTVVTVNVEDGNERYRITRHRKHKTGKNSLAVVRLDPSIGVAELALTKGTDKLTQEIVDKIIGSSLEVFRAAVYSGQEQMPDLPAMTDKNLKILIEEAAGVTLLEEAYRKAREKMIAIKGVAAAHQVQIEGVVRQQASEWDMLTRVNAQEATWNVQHKEEIDKIKADIKDRITAIGVAKTDLASYDQADLNAKIADRQTKIAGVDTNRQKMMQLVGDATAAKRISENRLAETLTFSLALAKAKKDKQDANHQIGCPCNECGRPLTAAELSALIKSATDRETVAEASLFVAKNEVANAESNEKRAQKIAEDFEKTLPDVSAVIKELGMYQWQLREAHTLEATLKMMIDSAKAEGERMKLLAVQTSPFESQIQAINQKMTDLAAALNKLNARMKELELDVEMMEAVVKVFSPAGARAVILDDVTPYLNTQTSQYLATLSDGNIDATWTTLVLNAKGELREKFSIDVTNAKGAKSFGGLSGGEKRKVRVATSMALQDLVATRAIKPIELFIGDEIDDALDPAGLERLTQILEDKAKERGTVMVISHNSLSDWISQIIQVEKKGGVTVVTEMVV